MNITQLLLIVVHRYYMRDVHLKNIEKAGVATSWQPHHDQYVKEWYGEHYSRNVQVHSPKN